MTKQRTAAAGAACACLGRAQRRLRRAESRCARLRPESGTGRELSGKPRFVHPVDNGASARRNVAAHARGFASSSPITIRQARRPDRRAMVNLNLPGDAFAAAPRVGVSSVSRPRCEPGCAWTAGFVNPAHRSDPPGCSICRSAPSPTRFVTTSTHPCRSISRRIRARAHASIIALFSVAKRTSLASRAADLVLLSPAAERRRAHR